MCEGARSDWQGLAVAAGRGDRGQGARIPSPAWIWFLLHRHARIRLQGIGGQSLCFVFLLFNALLLVRKLGIF